MYVKIVHVPFALSMLAVVVSLVASIHVLAPCLVRVPYRTRSFTSLDQPASSGPRQLPFHPKHIVLLGLEGI